MLELTYSVIIIIIIELNMLVIRIIAVVDDGDATARVDAAMPAKLIILWFIVRRQQQQPPAMQSHASQARDVM